jgi:hypothetical protein
VGINILRPYKPEFLQGAYGTNWRSGKALGEMACKVFCRYCAEAAHLGDYLSLRWTETADIGDVTNANA